MIRSRNIDPEAGKWSEPIKISSSVTAAGLFKNPTSHEILVDLIIANVTTAAASKYLNAGVITTGTTGTVANNELVDSGALVTGQTLVIDTPTTVPAGGSIIFTLDATDSTIDAYAYVRFKELTF
jgi:hypothetical protein